MLLAIACTALLATGHAAESAAPQAKITLVQLALRDQSPDSVIERMPHFFAEAKKNGSDLIVFPEYVLGYRIDADHPRV